MHRLTDLLKGCAAWVMRGLEQTRNSRRRRRMKVVESLALGGRRQLLLVLCDEQEYLVGAGAEGVETIVPRQPGTVAAQGHAQSGAGVHGALRSGAAKTGVGPRRGGTAIRERSPMGPWLVSRESLRIAENRIREAESGKGQHLWQ